MRKGGVCVVLILSATLGLVREVRADARDDLQDEMTYYTSNIRSKYWSLDAAAAAKAPKECDAAIAKAKKAGVKDSDELSIYAVDEVVPTDKDGAHGGEKIITVADASKICVRYADVYVYQSNRVLVQQGYGTAEWMKDVTTDEASGIQGLSKHPQACLDAIDALAKLGRTDVELDDGSKPTLDEAKAVCTQALADASKFESTVTGRETAEHDKIEAVYKAVGIKGKRLELFVYYGMPEGGSFLAAGCTKYVTTAKALKKAKKLFIWLTADDGVITVRKYTFKGDNYKTSEKQFLSEASAYRGCK